MDLEREKGMSPMNKTLSAVHAEAKCCDVPPGDLDYFGLSPEEVDQ